MTTQNDWEQRLNDTKQRILTALRYKGIDLHKSDYIVDREAKMSTGALDIEPMGSNMPWGEFIQRQFNILGKELADARREVIDSIHDKFCEFAIQGGDDEQAQKGILLYARTLQYLATLRKEGK